METITDWLQNPTVQIVGWVLGGMGWVIGIVSSWMQIKGYREQQRIEGAYRELFEHAQATWEARYTKEQVDELRRELGQMRDQIRSSVPLQARQVFLTEKAATLADNIAQMYDQYLRVQGQISTGSGTIDLPQGIRDAIESELMPAYLVRERRAQRMRRQFAMGFIMAVPLLLIWVVMPLMGSILMPFTILFVLGPIALTLFTEYVWPDIVGRFFTKHQE